MKLYRIEYSNGATQWVNAIRYEKDFTSLRFYDKPKFLFFNLTNPVFEEQRPHTVAIITEVGDFNE